MWGVFLCVLLIGLIYANYAVFNNHAGNLPVLEPGPMSTSTDITACKENDVRTDPVGNVTTCINGTWTYTGNAGSDKGS